MTEDNRRAMNDYLRRLRWALTPLPPRDREEIINELHAHFTDRLDAGADFETVATGFGRPEDYARSFLENYELTTALASGSTRSMAGVAIRSMGRGIGAFFGSLGVFIVFASAFVMLALALLKPLAPERVGLWTGHRALFLGMTRNPPGGYTEHLGYWIIPLLVLGAALLYLIGRVLLRAFLRARRS